MKKSNNFIYFLVTASLFGVVFCGSINAALTGVISGKIDDIGDNPLPGVTVVISGPNLQGDRTAYTNENGVFRFPELPPGKYLLTAQMMDMKKVEYPDIEVDVNKTTQVNFMMEMTDVEMTVVITADAPIVDVTSTTQAINIENEFTSKLPGDMDYQDSMILTGGMVGGGNPQVRGGTKMDNLYLLDGVDTTDTLTGTFGSNIAADALEQTEVQTGGFSAEYGRALGGIVNAVTKSGGNKFSGSLRMRYTDNTWESSSFYETTEPERDITWLPTMTLGGPIIRDRIWFFLTAWYFNNDQDTHVLSGPNDDRQDPSAPVSQDRTIMRPYIKFTMQPASSHKVTLKWNEEFWQDKSDNAANNVTVSTLTDYEQGGPFYGLDWTWLISGKSFMNFQTAFSEVYLNDVPANGDYSTPGYEDQARDITDRAPTEFRKNSRNRLNFNASYSWFMEEFIKGSHDFKAGAEYQHLWVDREVGIPGGFYYTFNTTGTGGTPMDQMTEVYSGGRTKYYGYYGAAYLQDSWKFREDMTLNWGFRPELMLFQNDVKKAQTEEIKGREPKTSTDNYVAEFFNVAPRFGYSWDIRGKGSDKLTVVLARYYNMSHLQIAQAVNELDTEYRTWKRDLRDGMTDNEKYDFSGSEEKFMDNDSRYAPDSEWEVYDTESFENNDTVNPDLSPEYADEFQIGTEHEVFPDVSVGWNYTYRKTKNIVEDVGVWRKTSTDEWFLAWDVPYDDYRRDVEDHPNIGARDYQLDHYTITNLPGFGDRDYNGLELSVRTQKKNFTFIGSYTYSIVEGTVFGDQPDFAGGGYSASTSVTSFSAYYDTPDLSRNVYGKLPYDINHYIKLNPAYDFFSGKLYAFSLGVSYFYRNGYAYSRRYQDPVYNSYAVYPGESDQWHPEWQGLEKGQGNYRMPPVSVCDLSVQKHFPLRQGKLGTFSVIFDVFNLFNSEQLIQRNMDDRADIGRPQTFGADGAHVGVRSYQMSMLFKF